MANQSDTPCSHWVGQGSSIRAAETELFEMLPLVRFAFGWPSIGTVFQVRSTVPSHRRDSE